MYPQFQKRGPEARVPSQSVLRSEAVKLLGSSFPDVVGQVFER